MEKISYLSDVRIGDVVEVAINQHEIIFRYKLIVTDIARDDEGEIIACGEGITKEHEDLAKAFTRIINVQNFYKIVS